MRSAAGDAASRIARSTVSRAAVPFWAAGAAAAILLVSTISLGAFDRAEPAPTPYAAGDEAELSLYSIAVLDAHVADEIEDQYVTAEDGETLVIVTARVENLASYPVAAVGSADRVSSRLVNAAEPLLALSGIPSTSSARVWRTDDSAGSVLLQPRVPAEVQVVWPVPEDAVADGRVMLDVYDAVEGRGQVILSSDHITWRRSALAARFTLDVAEAP